MEILSRKLNLAGRHGGGVMPYWSSLKAEEINHIFFADDILLFSNGSRTSFKNLLKVLSEFCDNSGQVLQANKCRVFFSNHINTRRQEDLKEVSGFSCGHFPIKYLGAPLFSGRARISYFQNIMDAVHDRIAGWTKSFLSFAGRLTMIQSVLMSTPIHSIAALPAPKGVIQNIERIIRSFFWSNGRVVKRHWVSWNNVCIGQEGGGLGIRKLGETLAGLRGKLAWNFLRNESLWAKNARSRFRISRKGSHLWGVISPYISAIALDCQWRVGNGATLVGDFCQNLAMEFPKRLKDISIKDALSNPNYRPLLLHNAPPRFLSSIQGDFWIDQADMLFWTKNLEGKVTTNSFISSFAVAHPKIRKFDIIWQDWLPLNISCFLWKVLRSAVPTDDRIRNIGISIASRCVCCRDPKEETLEHLLFKSDLAALVWDLLCPIFRRKRPDNSHEFFYEWGVSVNLRKFLDCLAFGLAACALWEIWKCRCRCVFDDQSFSLNKWTIFRWARTLTKSSGLPCVSDLRSSRICNALNIVVPLALEFKVGWRAWNPNYCGNTCNLAFHISDKSSSMAAIMRDRRGRFLFAMKLISSRKHFIKCFLHILSEILNANVNIACIKSDCSDLYDLGRDEEVDWSAFQAKRKVARLCGNMDVFRVCPALNRAAAALCYAEVGSLRAVTLAKLPPGVILALRNDCYDLPCSFMDQKIYM